MAKKIVVDLEAKTDKAVKEIADLKKEIQKLNKEVAEGNKDTKAGLQEVEKASDKTAGGVKKIGTGLKALGIGIIVAAFAKFTEVLNQNQKVADIFSTTFEVLSLAFNDFFNFIFDNVGGIVNAFKSLFTDPVQTIKDFGNALVDGVVVRFEQLVETLGFVAKGIGDLFKGNFKDAVDNFKQAGRESIDIITGQDESFEEVTSTIGNYVKETIKAGKENVKLNKEAEKARVLNQGIIEDYDRQAELLRQTRDDEFKTIDERIKANNDLKAVLDQQKEAMLANADAILTAAQAQFDKNGNDANAIALQEAKNEKAAIEAQITGFMSEQDSNRNALLREKLELEQSNTDAATERAKVERDFNAEQIENDVLRIQKQQENLKLEKEQELERLIAKRDTYTLGTQAFADAENERLAFIQEANNRETELGNELIEAKKIQAEEERNIEKQKITDKQMVLDAISQFADAESGIGKALLIAKQALALQETLLDVKRITFKGTKAVAEAGVDAAQNVSESSKIGFPQNIITIAAAIAQGIGIIRSVKKAVSKTKVPIGGASAEVPQVATPSGGSLPPAFNVVGAGGINQLATAIGEQQQQPVKAFVVSNDVSTAQELDRNIVQGAAIG
jgi:hypothetical protein